MRITIDPTITPILSWPKNTKKLDTMKVFFIVAILVAAVAAQETEPREEPSRREGKVAFRIDPTYLNGKRFLE